MSAYLPKLGKVPSSREMITVFRGYNHTDQPMLDEFYDMENMASGRYPALAPRGRRGLVRRLAKPNGLFARDRLCWVDGTDFYYDGIIRGRVTDCEKRFVAMGAYILVWPDKAYYNTETEEFGSLEARHETGGTVTFTLCRDDGSAYKSYTSSGTAPENPTDGQLWVDTNETPHALKQYSEMRGMWVSMPTTFVKIESPGIGKEFAEYDGVTVSGCGIEALNGDMILYGADENFILVTGVIDAAGSQDTPLTVERTAPDMDYLAESGNRVWGCSSASHEVYACALGDPKNWRRYMGVSTDSYAVTVGSPGPFTGACTHMGYVLFFKEDVIHKLYGTKPSNYQLTDTMARGVQAGSEQSLTVVNETLYYKARSGVCAYGAALPVGIGGAMGTVGYGKAVAGTVGDKYYVSMRDSAGAWSLFVYDELRGLWHREDDTEALAFARMDGTLYCLRADGALMTMNSARPEGGLSTTGTGGSGAKPGGAEGADGAVDGTLGPYADETAAMERRVKWMVETGDIGIGSPDRKYVSKLQVRLEVGEHALARVWVRYDHMGGWSEVYRLNPGVKRSYTVPIIPRRCDTMRIRMDGYGDVVIHGLTKTIEQGSDT